MFNVAARVDATTTLFELTQVLRQAAVSNARLQDAVTPMIHAMYRVRRRQFERSLSYPVAYKLIDIKDIAPDAVVLPFPFVAVVYSQEEATLTLCSYSGGCVGARIPFALGGLTGRTKYRYHESGVLCVQPTFLEGGRTVHFHVRFDTLGFTDQGLCTACSAWEYCGTNLVPQCMVVERHRKSRRCSVNVVTEHSVSDYVKTAYGWVGAHSS